MSMGWCSSGSDTGQPQGGRLARRVRLVLCETGKLLHHGANFPRSGEAIVVETARIERVIAHPLELAGAREAREAQSLARSFALARAARGRVLSAQDFVRIAPRPLDELVKLQACLAHWRDGVAWEATGIFEHLLRKIAATGQAQSGCGDIEAIRMRYARLDAIFAQVRAEGRLRGQRERDPRLRREHDGIEIHLGEDGAPIFGDRGNHRLAMALALELPEIPAMLGFVHVGALDTLGGYRAAARRVRARAALAQWDADAREDRAESDARRGAAA